MVTMPDTPETIHTGPLHPADPKKHRKVLRKLLLRILTADGVRIGFVWEPDSPVRRTGVLDLPEVSLILDKDEIDALAVENNRLVLNPPKRKG